MRTRPTWRSGPFIMLWPTHTACLESLELCMSCLVAANPPHLTPPFRCEELSAHNPLELGRLTDCCPPPTV